MSVRRVIPYVFLAVLGLAYLAYASSTSERIAEVSYSQFETELNDGKIESLSITADTIRGTYKEPVEGHTGFATVRIDPALAESLDLSGVEVTGERPNTFLLSLLGWIVPLFLIILFWVYVSRTMTRSMSGYTAIGKTRAKVFTETETGVTFDDVAGVDEAKAELKEIVDFLNDPEAYGRLGAHVPKGVLLVGPPGTGKTLLARAVAGQAGVPFFSISGSEFVELFVGVGAARVRDLFDTARKSAPAIIFIDELDALGRARGVSQLVTNDEREQTLNQLLAELDGFDPSAGIVLLAATNRPEILDPALLRAGRFDRQVLVDRPDKIGRVAILKVHIRGIILGSDVELENVAALTTGFTGADLANLVNEAAILATRRSAQHVELKDFEDAIERIVAGLEKKNRVLNEMERRVIAHHEIGHALTSLAMPGGDPIQKVSIIPRGVGALGYTIQRPTEDRYLMTRSELERKICVLLGGRAAESLVFEDVSTGAADDLVKATEIARCMVELYGMDTAIGHVSFQSGEPNLLGETYGRRSVSEATAQQIDEAIRQIIKTEFDRAVQILRNNLAILKSAAEALLEKETLTEGELSQFASKLTGNENAPLQVFT